MYRGFAVATAVLAVSGTSVAAMFDEVDASGDGIITREEFVGSGLFDRWDNDNDGALTRDELSSDLVVLREADEDGTGDLRRREFYNSAFADLDTDLDGVVSAQEYRDDPGWFENLNGHRLSRRAFDTYRIGRSSY